MAATNWTNLLLLPFLLAGFLAPAQAQEPISVGTFSSMAPHGPVAGWESLTFRGIEKQTVYALVADAGQTVLQAESRASASCLVRQLDIDPLQTPILRWRWKVNRILDKGDLSRKAGDDYPARIYLTFADPPEGLSFFQRTQQATIRLLYGRAPPTSSLNYIWGNRAAAGSFHPNPFTDRVQMVVVESGSAHLGQWRSAQRNIVEDYRRAFGTDPPPITSIAVMTDSDNTGEMATAWYGDIVLEPKKERN